MDPSAVLPPIYARVLVVDDDPAICRVLTRLLDREGCEVRAALSAEYAAVHMSAPEKIDAIICNGLDGAWRQVADLAHDAKVPIVIYSGSQSIITKANNSGLPTLQKGDPDARELLLAFVRDATPPPCPECNGYGSDDGLPCGTPERDFGPDAPGSCEACSGTGDKTPTTNT